MDFKETQKKYKLHKKRDLIDIQKDLYHRGELCNDQVAVTQSENTLGQALIDAGIPVIPQFEMSGKSFDFKLRDYAVLIEVDGSVHNAQHKRVRDYRKDRRAMRKGFRVIRFANFEVRKYTDGCVKEVQSMIWNMQKQPRIVEVYVPTLREHFGLWWKKLRGKEGDLYESLRNRR